MNTIRTTQAFEKQHPGLTAMLAGIAPSLFPSKSVTLRDGDEAAAPNGPVINVRRGPDPMLVSANGHREFVYTESHSELALAGLLARISDATGGGPIAADPQSLSIYALAGRLAGTDVPVLITGPTGTGKEVLSQFIHNQSPRKNKSFVAINCAAIPETMLEALLFGHVKGSFTGANAASTGFFREADGGTLLLDEIAEMPLSLQAKLLRALQEGEVIPVGSTKPIKIDVRIIACANRDLPAEVAAGRFREDLFYRLNVFPMELPALRDRPADIAPLAHMLLLRHANPATGPLRFAQSAMAMLRCHGWPGNVRELENVLRRALVLADGQDEIGPEHIAFDGPARLESATPAPAESVAQSTGGKLSNIVQLSEARAIMETLRSCGGKRIAAARQLGISERTLRYRLANFREAGFDMGAAS